MVSNSKDDHPSKTTPIIDRAPNTLPRTVNQAAKNFKSVGREVKTANDTYRFTV